MRSRIWLALAACLALGLTLGVSACGSSKSTSSSSSSSSGGGGGSAGGTINGAGSTFAAPIYMQWGSTLKGQGVTVNYQAVGSGAGITQWAAGTADFGASDPPLKPADKASGAKKGTAVQIPTAFGATTVSYNLQGVKSGLKLDGATIADIFLGKVKSWGDPAIAKLNPGLKLPSSTITVVHRSDASGTTAGFTSFLAADSPAWASKVGTDKTVKWPTGTGAKGNAGVAAAVKQTPGAVGYVEEAYALQNNFTTASVKNKSGNYVAPTLASTTAAGEGVSIPADLGIKITNAPGAQAYPIASQTFVVVFKDMCKAGISKGTAGAVKKFIDYGLGAGQSVLSQLQYAQLPPAVLTKAKAASSSLTCNGAAL
ncbi:MAG: phosphate ABC transporter substrate-binding protein PstS [Thermoleophilaceae bacterium]